MILPVSLASTKTPLQNIPYENPFFVGREAQLKNIQSFFKSEGSIVALTGGPGFGKSQIAKQYALNFEKDYELIWWFDA